MKYLPTKDKGDIKVWLSADNKINMMTMNSEVIFNERIYAYSTQKIHFRLQ